MIETLYEVFAQYGLLGVVITFMIYAVRYMAKRDEVRDAKVTQVVENNTIALTRFIEQTKKCEVKS